MGKGKAPKPPDPVKLADKQFKINQATSSFDRLMNMMDQEGPDGSLTYAQSGTRDWIDPMTGKVMQVPTYKATTTLSGAQQAIKDSSDAAKGSMARAAEALSAKLSGAPLDMNSKVADWLYEMGANFTRPELQRNRASLDARLAEKGIRLGSTAYDRAMEAQGRTENDAYNQLALSSRKQAFDEALAKRSFDVDEINRLMGGAPAGSVKEGLVPTSSSNTAVPNFAEMANQAYQNQMAAYQQKEKSLNEKLGGMFGMLGNFIKPSDRRLKEDIKQVGKTNDGQNIYSYRYKGGKAMHLGLMAQEVERKKPGAVGRDGIGFRFVDYAKALEDT